VPPFTGAALDPPEPDGADGWYTRDVRVTLEGTDACAGVDKTEYSLDGGATWTAYSGTLTITTEGTTSIAFRSLDVAGNIEEARSLTLRLDKTAPAMDLTATPSVIWPPNGETVEATLTAAGSDAISGLAGVTYVVADEYGTLLTIPSRALSGAAASWQDVLGVEARREGADLDGRLYRVTATITDRAGHSTSRSADILVPHDRR
jgi:hypothetical protein